MRELPLADMPAWLQYFVPRNASTLAPKVDDLYLALIGVTVFLVAGLALANLYILIRYREGSPAPRPPLKVNPDAIETIWIVITTIVFLTFFFLGAHLYLYEEVPPRTGLEIELTARQWMWDFRQPNGHREFNELHLPVGEDVRLAMTSEDVIHSFYVPAFRFKQDVVPGKTILAWFHPTRVGRYHLFCAEYCGTAHSAMTGEIVVMPPAAYARWLVRGNIDESLAERGRRLFIRYNCAGCHDQPAAVHAPPLVGLFGAIVPLSDGRKVRADDRYIRDSILQAGKDIVAGYDNIMPVFQNIIPEGDVLDLIAYIKSLPAATSGTGIPPALQRP